MKDKTNIVLYILGGIGVIWFALLVAPYLSSGLIGIINNLQVPFVHRSPFPKFFFRSLFSTFLEQIFSFHFLYFYY